MVTPSKPKSTVEEIRQRFDNDVERFADIETGQSATIDREDSPRPVTYQLELLRAVGFHAVELLHKNACFAAFGAIKRQ